MGFRPRAAYGRDGVEKIRHDFGREPEQMIAFVQCQQILRLAERDGFTVAASQTGKTRRRTLDNFDAKITVCQAMP